MYKLLLSSCLGILFCLPLLANNSLSLTPQTKKGFKETNKVYVLKLQDEINAPAWRKVKLGMEAALNQEADVFLLHLNTYGGRVDFADSIRSALLAYKIPTAVYIQDNAASAGALISIACDSIYMAIGSTIGAATVVDGEGTEAAEKYQSFFRGKMRATAVAKNRNPDIAEGMVDKRVVVEGVVDEERLITFTTEEAIANGFCEGAYNSFDEFITDQFPNATIVNHQTSGIEQIILYLINPAVSGFLIMIIIGGIYFELQSPGIGFPILLSILAAILFFAPHYLQGLANNWEIILFVVGLLLIAVEVFILPGFGIAGVLGLICLVSGLAFSLFSIEKSEEIGWILPNMSVIVNSFGVVTLSILLSTVVSFYLSKKILTGNNFISGNAVLQTELKESKIQLSNQFLNEDLEGKTGITITPLMPGGKIRIDGESLDAIAESGFIETNQKIKVIRISNIQLIVKKIEA